MAIKDFPNVNPDANATFGLESNTSEFRSVLSNDVQHMSLPGDRWVGSVSFTNRTRNEANKIKAFKASLGGQSGRFYFTPVDAYQSGTMGGSGVVNGAVASGSSSLPTNGWTADQDTLFEAGDYLEVNGELKMVVDDVAAPQSYIEYTGANYMPSPFDPEGWTGVSDPDGTITNVTLENPSGKSFVGLAEVTGTGFFILNSTTSSPASVDIGDKVYFAILCQNINIDALLECYFDFGGADDQRARVKVSDGTNEWGIKNTSINFSQLSDGSSLIQVEYISTVADTVTGRIVFLESGGTVPTIGSQLYVQAAYFGKADDWPAQLLATANIPIAPPLRRALAGGEAITTTNPRGVFYLGSNSQEWSINVNGVQDMGFDFIEDVN